MEVCPKCGESPFEQFLPATVVRWPYRFLFFGSRPRFAIICRGCKEIVGYEDDAQAHQARAKEFRGCLEAIK